MELKRVYGSQKSVMVSEEDEDSPVKCRERRRRRIQMRRMGSVSGSSGGDGVEGQKLAGSENSVPAAATASATAILSLISIMEAPLPPVVGTLAVIGRQREMEDEISVRTDLCRPEINGYRPVHFFGVFDGHGGRHVSALCKENMHVIMEEELMRVKAIGDELSGSGGGVGELWRSAINRSFQRMDEMALRLCLCGGLSNSSVCRCNAQLALMGSTAVVAILTKECIFVANCGDSRAVLCRDGRAIPLSVDHKPEREDERARIECAGGRIMFGDGPRVEGILAMSRAIGDRLLKQSVTSQPEISVTRREPGDECLILATDGLWDVVSSELACQVVHKCLQEDQNQNQNQNQSPNPEPQIADEGAALYPSQSSSAAALLVRLALGRQSTDNISVVVIDLRKN